MALEILHTAHSVFSAQLLASSFAGLVVVVVVVLVLVVVAAEETQGYLGSVESEVELREQIQAT